MNARGFSLAELLVSLAIVFMLLVAVGAAIVQTLHVQLFHAQRAAFGRTEAGLSERLNEEARSATAVFVPSTDILGNANTVGGAGHEVDFFRRLSAGGDAYVAYYFDASSGNVTRYEYSIAAGLKKTSAADLAASDLAGFSAIREPVAKAATIVGESDPPSVPIAYGSPELVGGNDLVVVTFQSRPHDGIASDPVSVHLASRVTPTALAVLAPIVPPTPPPGSTVFPFIILRPGFKVVVPHGPMHGGGLGGPDSLLHWVAAAGSAQFFGESSTAAGTWFEFSALYPRVESGVFTFKASDGASITASITCADGPCPSFKPLPVSAPGVVPPGSLAFQMSKP